MTVPLIQMENVSRRFQVKRDQYITAVNDVSLTVDEGEILCLVGESGCGKTTAGKMIAGLLATSEGRVFYKGQDIAQLKGQAFKDYRLAVQMVHQDPYASLNPSHTIYETISFPLKRHNLAQGDEAIQQRARKLLTMVDITPPDDFLNKFPHQLSGGQRQRVSVARMLTVNPSFIVADEAVSMVDVSIRISLLNTLLELKQKMGLAVVFITHDLALAKYFAWDGAIAVMYLGKIVEMGPARRVVDDPQHPYTQVLLSAVPDADLDATLQREPIQLRSMDVPSLLRLPTGCSFHPRCPYFEGEQCEKVIPQLTRLKSGVSVACHLVLREHEADLA